MTLAYSTYLGGSDVPAIEEGDGIAVDSAGAAYVTGFTDSADFPTEDAFQARPGRARTSTPSSPSSIPTPAVP